MVIIKIYPKLIGTWFPPGVGWDIRRIQSLAKLVKSKGWNDIPKVPVYELPNALKTEQEYLLADGHKRRFVAENFNIQLPCAVYLPGEIIQPKKDNLGPFEFLGNPNGSEHYVQVLELYKNPAIIERWIQSHGKTKWDEKHVKNLFL